MSLGDEFDCADIGAVLRAEASGISHAKGAGNGRNPRRWGVGGRKDSELQNQGSRAEKGRAKKVWENAVQPIDMWCLIFSQTLGLSR